MSQFFNFTVKIMGPDGPPGSKSVPEPRRNLLGSTGTTRDKLLLFQPGSKFWDGMGSQWSQERWKNLVTEWEWGQEGEWPEMERMTCLYQLKRAKETYCLDMFNNMLEAGERRGPVLCWYKQQVTGTMWKGQQMSTFIWATAVILTLLQRVTVFHPR